MLTAPTKTLQQVLGLSQVQGDGASLPRWEDGKTEGSRRKVVLTAAAGEVLRQHCIRQREERHVAGTAWQEHDLVFCNRWGGPLFKGNMLSQHYRRIVTRSDLPYIRFHDLRHTA